MVKTTARDYFASLNDEQTAEDANVLLETMQRISGAQPQLWNAGTIGFDSYHYKYDSGREGDSFVIGFYSRKGKVTIYLMDGTTRYSDLLAKLGTHTITGYCISFKKLKDIDQTVLEQIIDQSYRHIKKLTQDGPINRILWQTEK